MLEKRLGLLLIQLSFPAGMGMIAFSLLALLDSYFIARLGPACLAAVTLSIPIQVLITSVASSTGVGLTSLISRTLGKGEVRLAGNIAWHGLLLSIVLGLFFLLAGWYFLDELLLLSGCTAEILILCKEYLQIILLGSVFTFIPIITGSIVQGQGNTFLPILVYLVGMTLNVAFDPLLIFGWGCWPGMGLNGAAWANVLSQAVSTVLVMMICFRQKGMLKWSVSGFKPSLKVLGGIYKVALPAMFMEIAGVFNMAVLNRVLAGYSYLGLAALAILLRTRSLAYMPVFGLTQGVMPIAGFAYGAKNYDRVKESIIKTSIIAFIILAGAWLVIQSYPQWIMNCFSEDPGLSAAGINCLRLTTIFWPLMGPVFIISSVLQAVGKAVPAMFFSLIRQLGFFLLPLFILPPYLGINGVWLVFSLSELLSAALLVFFLAGLWSELQPDKKNRTLILLPVSYIVKRLRVWLRW